MAFARYIVVCNPISTDAHKAARRIHELRECCPESEIIVINTARGGYSANTKLLARYSDKLGEQTLLCIAAGDGTINMLLNILLRDPSIPEAARRTPLLPLWGGNANDLAHMLNGPSGGISCKTLLKKGRVVVVRPLECTLTTEHTTTIHLAACYASFGASGYAMKQLERSIRARSPMRQPAVTRFGRELVEVSRFMVHARTFTITEAGHKTAIFERIFLNGSRFAKIAAVPLKLTEPRFHRTTAERKSLFTLFIRLIELMRDRAGGRVSATHDTFIISSSVWAQFDGETVRISPGTQVDMRVGEEPFYAWSTKL